MSKILLFMAKWILGMIDVSVTLEGDLLHITLKIGNKTVVDWEIDLIKQDVMDRYSTAKVGRLKK